MERTKVYIVGPSYGYSAMFTKQGWDIADAAIDADLIQFTGGEDVSPELYGEEAHMTTSFNPERDKREALIFELALANKIPMAGICRGGQFLNVMCGGRMWQNVNNHAISGMHKVKDLDSGDEFWATSTHHQMMRVGPQGRILAVGVTTGPQGWGKTTVKENMAFKNGKWNTQSVLSKEDDVEVVFYAGQNCLCFQPHPEFHGQDMLRQVYFDYLYNYLEVL